LLSSSCRSAVSHVTHTDLPLWLGSRQSTVRVLRGWCRGGECGAKAQAPLRHSAGKQRQCEALQRSHRRRLCSVRVGKGAARPSPRSLALTRSDATAGQSICLQMHLLLQGLPRCCRGLHLTRGLPLQRGGAEEGDSAWAAWCEPQRPPARSMRGVTVARGWAALLPGVLWQRRHGHSLAALAPAPCLMKTSAKAEVVKSLRRAVFLIAIYA
jgi:hypothetical protein